MAKRPASFQARGLDSNNVLEVVCRFKAKPHDRTLGLHVFHRTIDGGVGVLLGDADVQSLVGWLNRQCPAEPWSTSQRTGQTAGRVAAAPDSYQFKFWWLGSGRSRTVTVDVVEVERLAGFLADALADRLEPPPWRPAPAARPTGRA